MSITSPEPNVVYDNDQAKQIETFKLHLLGLETDITIHSRTLRNLQAGIVNATNENDFLLRKNESLSASVIEFQAKHDKLIDIIERKNDEIQNLQIESERIKNLHNDVRDTLATREQEVKKSEGMIKKDRLELNNKLIEVAQIKESLSKKQAILAEAIKSIGN